MRHALLVACLVWTLFVASPPAPTHGQQPTLPSRPEIWFAPGPETDFEALFRDQASWAEALATIEVLCVPLAWIGDPLRANAAFLNAVFIPTLRAHDVKLCVDAGPGARWDAAFGRALLAEESFGLERPLWDRLRQALGPDGRIDYVRLDGPNHNALLPLPRGAGLPPVEAARQTALYMALVAQSAPEAKIGIADWLFDPLGRWETYLPDTQNWLTLLQTTLGRRPDFVHFELVTDADAALPPHGWLSRAREAAPAVEFLSSRQVPTGVAIMDRARSRSADGTPLADDRAWFEERLVRTLVTPYRQAGVVPDVLVVGARERALQLTPDSGPHSLTFLVRMLRDLFRDDGLPALLLREAPPYEFPGVEDLDGSRRPADSNSPSHWDDETLYLFNSAHRPWRSAGWDLFNVDDAEPVEIDSRVGDVSRWLEATYKDDDGTLYGWYHHEPDDVCPRRTNRADVALTAPQIGAMRSRDDGRNWRDLGIVMTAPSLLRCDTQNHYYAGGLGDFSVMLDQQGQFFYFYFSTFAGDVTQQGIAVARMPYGAREAPVGQVWKWRNGAWSEPGLGGGATPIFPAAVDWHRYDAFGFWGPSIHWNTYLGQYVMTLNRADNGQWAQEGAYASFSGDLGNPLSWTVPKKFRGRGGWYAQVVGTDATRRETDKLAGRTARYFEQGVSRYEVVFLKPDEARVTPIRIP